MKRQTAMMMSLLLVISMIFGFAGVAAAQTEEYIPVHTEEELSALFSQVKGYLDENGEEILSLLDDTESQIVTNALVRAWGITQYEDASPQQIDDAYVPIGIKMSCADADEIALSIVCELVKVHNELYPRELDHDKLHRE